MSQPSTPKKGDYKSMGTTSRPGSPKVMPGNSPQRVSSPMSVSSMSPPRAPPPSMLRKVTNAVIQQPAKFPEKIIEYVNNNECKFTVAFKKIVGNLASIDNIYNFINETFTKYQYKGTSVKTTGIKVGLFELNPEPFPNFPNNKSDDWFEIAIKNNNQIFKIEKELKDKLGIKWPSNYFYFKIDSGPTYWETDNFQNMDKQVYIFLCTTHKYLPVMHDTENKVTGFGHSWLTTVLLNENGTYITNIFDSNSTHIFNFQYARKLEMLTGVYILPRTINPSISRSIDNSYIFCEGDNSFLYFLNCQNKQSSNPGQECIGLQNNDKWGFCQTFMLIMYLVILHNPILAEEPLEVVMKRPGLDKIIGTKEGFLGFLDGMLKIVNDVSNDVSNNVSKKYEFGRSPRRSLKSRRSKRRQSFKKQIKNKNKRVKKSNGRKKRTCAY